MSLAVETTVYVLQLSLARRKKGKKPLLHTELYSDWYTKYREIYAYNTTFSTYSFRQ